MEQRQKTLNRDHNPDASIRITESCREVHAGNDSAADGILEDHRKPDVSLLRRNGLGLPCRQWMGGRHHHPGPLLFGRFNHDPPGFDLGTHEFVRDLVRPTISLACLHDGGVGSARRSPDSGSTIKNSS